MSEPLAAPALPRFVCHRLRQPGAAAPAGTAKVVHFIRHGEAAHQLAHAEAARRGAPCRCPDLAADDPARKECPYRDPALTDAPLTARGREQSRGCAAGCPAELVLTATLTRCLETALVAFPPPGPPVVALDELRPRVSAHRHSRRSPLSRLRARFPTVSFALIADEEDALWRPVDEPRSSIDARAARFLRLLVARPERSVAVVTHFTTLFALFGGADDVRMLGRDALRPAGDPPWLECAGGDDDHPLRRHLEPGEVRSFALVPRAPHRSPGGR